MAENNEPAQAENQQEMPTLNVILQYIKDFSFENPGAPASMRPREQAPDIQLNINVGANALSETDYEVELKLEAGAKDGEETLFQLELVYAGIFRLSGIPEEAKGPAVLIECPRLLFPFARQIVGDATRNGGFPPLMIDPVDFARLYQQRMMEQAQAAGDAGTVN